MERRYEARLKEMLAQTKVSPQQFAGMMDRLEAFVEPYADSLAEPEQQRHAIEYISGLLSKLDHKTGEAIAYLHDHERQGIQKFIGDVPWGYQPLLMTLARQVGAELGEPDGVLVFDPSGFPKKGTSWSAWRGSGAAGSGRSITARSPSPWPTFRGENKRS